MADNVAITAGSGTDIATDDVGSVHYQKVKVMMGGDGVEGNQWAGVLQTGSNAIGKLAANTGVDIGDVDVTSIAAGDNNIGNVDIVTLPAGNLGQQAMAASLSVVPASDVTDATYIGDIKFGEALPAGSNAIGKLAANTGVDIGDVDVTSQPARDRLTDNVGVAFQTDALLNDVTALTPTVATINVTASGVHTVISGSAGKQIKIIGGLLMAQNAVEVNLHSDNDKAIMGPLFPAQEGGFQIPYSPTGAGQPSDTNEGITMTLSRTERVGGYIAYVEV